MYGRASSVLQKNVRSYGPMNALDCTNTSTSWNSEGSPTGKKKCFFVIEFNRPVRPVEFRVQYQAGFAAEAIEISQQNNTVGRKEEEGESDDKRQKESWEILFDVEAEDDHDLQRFSFAEHGITTTTTTNTDIPPTTSIKLSFDEYTDFYGRVIIYQIQVWGYET